MTKIYTSTEAVERLLDGVTPGDWISDGCRVEAFRGFSMEDRADYWEAVAECENERDTHFIAAARDMVPALLKERDEARARIDELEAFITDFASAKFDSLPQPYIRHPADEPDPVTEATTVWAWQEDAKGLLKGETK